jgi:GT2 family glycosyltransferase
VNRWHQDNEAAERQLRRRLIGGRTGQRHPRPRVHRLCGDDPPQDALGRAPVAALIGELGAEEVDLPVGIELPGTMQERGGLRGVASGEVRAGGQQRRRVVDVVGLADTDGEPGADENREEGRQRSQHGADDTARPRVSVVIPVWNGRRWLEGCLASIVHQTEGVHEVIAVDNGSVDGSVAHLREAHPGVRVLELGANTGFAHAVNQGIRLATGDYVALLNTDVELAPDWVARLARVLHRHPEAAAVACKMVELADPDRIYDAGDVLRRDGACEQRGRFGRDDGSFDAPGEVFGACAGAALYRRAAVLGAGGFDERYFAYLEDVDLALALRVAGWRCRYEPAVARHAGEGSSPDLRGGHRRLVARNTVLLVAKWFPARWLPLVAYRQAAWLWHAARERRLREHLRGLAAGLAVAGPVLIERAHGPRPGPIPLASVVPRQPIRGPRALGHPSRRAAVRPPSPRPPSPPAPP